MNAEIAGIMDVLADRGNSREAKVLALKVEAYLRGEEATNGTVLGALLQVVARVFDGDDAKAEVGLEAMARLLMQARPSQGLRRVPEAEVLQ